MRSGVILVLGVVAGVLLSQTLWHGPQTLDHIWDQPWTNKLPHTRDAEAATGIHSLIRHAAHLAGIKSRIKFAHFKKKLSLSAILRSPSLQSGALLIVLPGDIVPARRKDGQPFFTLHTSALLLQEMLPLATIQNAALAMEKKILGRRLHAFQLQLAALPLCASGSGACAIWEGGSGMIVMDEGIAQKMAGTQHLGDVLTRFTDHLALEIIKATNGSRTLNNTHTEDKPRSCIVDVFLTSALSFAAVSSVPFWWCVVCPIVLGLLAPFVFNFGLTAAAEELCATMQLPAQECNDLWWGVFALALILSLGSAIPIVFVCKLNECARRRILNI